jgi:probable phosphoglycerate mutase
MRQYSGKLLATEGVANRYSRVAYLVCLPFVLILVAPPAVPAQSAETLRIYLVRHGETDWNVEARVQGGTDTELNATGRQQAAELAARFKGVRFDAVYSSTLKRSRDTAELLRGPVPLTSLAGLNDRKQGKFEGQRIDGSDPASAAEYKSRSADPKDSLDGGESLNQFSERIRAAIALIRNQHPTGAVLIVGHFITNQMILSILLNLTSEQSRSINQSNDEVYMTELESGNPPRLWKLISEKNLSDL